jgi:hypothetical protein
VCYVLQMHLADFWLFEHLLVLPSSIATEEIVSHLGAKFPHRDTENGALPAPVSARLFLRHLRSRPNITDWQELLELLGLFCMLSCKRHQFRNREAAKAISPPTELLTEVSAPPTFRHCRAGRVLCWARSAAHPLRCVGRPGPHNIMFTSTCCR